MVHMKRLLLLSLFALSAVFAAAEQRVVVINAFPSSGWSGGMNKPDLSQVNTLLANGWHVVLVSVGGTGSEAAIRRILSYVFVLERPDNYVEPVRPQLTPDEIREKARQALAGPRS